MQVVWVKTQVTVIVVRDWWWSLADLWQIWALKPKTHSNISKYSSNTPSNLEMVETEVIFILKNCHMWSAVYQTIDHERGNFTRPVHSVLLIWITCWTYVLHSCDTLTQCLSEKGLGSTFMVWGNWRQNPVQVQIPFYQHIGNAHLYFWDWEALSPIITSHSNLCMLKNGTEWNAIWNILKTLRVKPDTIIM